MNTNLFVKFHKGRKQYAIICKSFSVSTDGYVMFFFSSDCTFIKGAKIEKVHVTSMDCYADAEVQSLFSLTANVS